MPGVPSNKACGRCKKRHLKCDETRPHCQRCTDAGVECPGFVQTRKFIDQGASVRKRYAPYQENGPKPTTAKAKRQHLEVQNGDGSSLQSQGQSTSQMPPLDDVDHRPAIPSALDSAPILPPIQAHASNVVCSGMMYSAAPDSSWPGSDARIGPPATVGDASAGAGTFTEHPSQPSPNTRPSLSRTPSQRGEQEEFQDIFSELMTGTEHEISFLTRHYCEVISSWFDVSDSRKFFGGYVPIRAIDEQSLRYAIAAISAKHLARMKGVKSVFTGGLFTSPATMETYPSAHQVDWSLKAANYYYLAVSHMNKSMSDYAAVSTSDVLEPPISVVNRWLNLQLKRGEEGPRTTDGTWKTTENLLATSTILTLYKTFDEPGENWQSYLAGVKQLFSQLLGLTRKDGDRHFSPGVTAVFWNFARMDYLASYYNRLPTHLNPDDIAVWQAAGLSLDEQGNLDPPDVPRTQAFSREDMATNVLTRLLNKLTNYLAAAKKSQLENWVGGSSPEPSSRSSSHSPDSHPTTATWLKLSFEFQSWVERIPETFRPCLRIERPKPSPTDTSFMPFPEIFYSLTSCAAAMQQYHFGRLALSLNRPSDDIAGPSTAFDRLQSYRELTKEVDYRCKEICGIALGRPQSGARVQMITLLYAVGQCLERPEERQIVMDLLRGIEADLGWSTASQVQKLQK
ncbi:Zn(II)2Cys6 transcription factor [Aspergillus mulundensis]|uniref:Putative Zn(II)2Cys6 transcription factor n=1 Tax=Aspergillus mulundensis TaxID=1810919 RepID=A0A3D8QV55_9EURO|nr:putative Zn(II)2Cys6 transcription factor [Aspergillus mulundensis]RDW65726.1 putative Zn(II)2Cys6 transcription factor [Aspergillus mulundensis]